MDKYSVLGFVYFRRRSGAMGIDICDGGSGVKRRGDFTAAFNEISYQGTNSVRLSVIDEQNTKRELFITKEDAQEILKKDIRYGEKISVSFEEGGCCEEHTSPRATVLERYSQHEFQLSFNTQGKWSHLVGDSQLPRYEVAGESEPAIALRGKIISDQGVEGMSADVILPAEEREAFVRALSALTSEKGACRKVSMTTGFNSMTEIKKGVFRVHAPEAEKVIFSHPPTPRKGMLG